MKSIFQRSNYIYKRQKRDKKMENVQFSIPHKIEKVKGILSTRLTVVFEEIPTEEDVINVVEEKKRIGLENPHSMVVCLGQYFIFTFAFQNEKFHLIHESSFLEKGTNYYIISSSSYDDVVSHVKELLLQEIEIEDIREAYRSNHLLRRQFCKHGRYFVPTLHLLQAELLYHCKG